MLEELKGAYVGELIRHLKKGILAHDLILETGCSNAVKHAFALGAQIHSFQKIGNYNKGFLKIKPFKVIINEKEVNIFMELQNLKQDKQIKEFFVFAQQGVKKTFSHYEIYIVSNL